MAWFSEIFSTRRSLIYEKVTLMSWRRSRVFKPYYLSHTISIRSWDGIVESSTSSFKVWQAVEPYMAEHQIRSSSCSRVLINTTEQAASWGQVTHLWFMFYIAGSILISLWFQVNKTLAIEVSVVWSALTIVVYRPYLCAFSYSLLGTLLVKFVFVRWS